jgi:hypothetical protein
MIFSLMPAAEEPKAGVCAEVLARSYPSLPFGLLKRAIWPLRSDQLPGLPLRVKSVVLAVGRPLPVHPDQRTSADWLGWSGSPKGDVTDKAASVQKRKCRDETGPARPDFPNMRVTYHDANEHPRDRPDVRDRPPPESFSTVNWVMLGASAKSH